MSKDVHTVFERKWSSTHDQINILKKKITRYVWFRFLSFFLGLGIAVILYRISPLLSVGILILFLSFFFYFVKRHLKYKSERTHLQNLLRVLEKEMNILKLDFKELDTGSEFLHVSNPKAADLDIFGDNSMFQLLNRTHTREGKEKLAEQLDKGLPEEDIPEEQEAVRELSPKIDFKLNFQATGLNLYKTLENSDELHQWFDQENYFSRKNYLRILAFLLPGITITLGILFAFGLPIHFFLIAGLLQLGITSVFLKKINRMHDQVSKKYSLFEDFSLLFKKIENSHFQSEKLIRIKSRLKRGDISAGSEINKLANLIRYLDNRLNMLASIVLNGVLLWDINLMLRIEAWKKSVKGVVKQWFDALAAFESILSKAAFAFQNPAYVYPEQNQGMEIKAKEMGHPLIRADKKVKNDFSLQQKGEIMLITGSNMAGKSTYLRTIGFNMTLAMAGCPVCADSFSFHKLHMLSSMRVKDNLREEESTFYAELKRLKNILDYIKKDKALILLDEILKGTNSKDKLTGSFALIRQLVQSDSMAVIATHDLDLAVLEKEYPEKLSNYNFEVNIRDGEFYFDYKLKNGVCKVLNATELMRTMGIEV